MILLPDIRLGSKLSIQDPFTLNGYLIVDIDILGLEMSYNTVPSGRVIIKNENNYSVELRFEELEYRFNKEMEHFIYTYSEYAHVEGRRDITNWSNYTFNKYINEIKKQCDRIHDSRYYSLNYSSNNYLNALRNDLIRQGRDFESSRINRNNFIDDYYRHMYGYYGYGIADTSVVFNNISGRWGSYTGKKKYIHDYNYKPEYIHHYMPDEDKDTTLLLGAEIEVDCGGKSEENAKNVLEIIHGTDSEDKMFCVSDGSLTNGLEFVTMPCSLEYHKKEMKYKEMFDYLNEHGYKAHDTTTCGLHIHADRKYLGKSELVQQLTISKILYILEKFNDEICVIARRNNSYSKFVGNGKAEKSVIELYEKYKNNIDKYAALNLKHYASVEFRCFKGTLKYETFILTLEFVKDIIDFAKSINIEEIEIMKWSDLMSTFSNELKEYYNDRLEKENKKKEKKNVQTNNYLYNSSYVDTWSHAALTLDTSNLIANTFSIDDYLSISNELTRFHESETQALLLDSLGSFAREYESQWGTTKSEEEKLKDKIKSLKKKIKNSNNFMEKKNLEKELNETQKELKKEKKKKKTK